MCCVQQNKNPFKARLLKGLAFFCLKFCRKRPIGGLSSSMGWFSTFFLSLCGLPEAVHSVLTKSSDTPWSLLIFWGLGELCAIFYVLPKRDWPLLLNYLFNCVCILTIIFAGKL